MAAGNYIFKSQCNSLKNLYDSTGGDNWHYAYISDAVKWNFTSSETYEYSPCGSNPCDWTGLMCSSGPTIAIASMSLVSFGLDGIFPLLSF